MKALRRFLESRGMRKFKKDRLAVAGTFVIFLYMLVALSVVFGAVTLTDTKERVLPNRFPGFLEDLTTEERFGVNRWWWEDHFEPVLVERADSFETQEELRRVAIDELDLAERKLLDAPLEEVMALVEETQAAWEDLRMKWILRDEMIDEALALQILMEEEGEDPDIVAAIEEMQVEAERYYAEAKEAMGVFEAKALELQPIPPGFAGFKYELRTFLGSDSKGGSISAQAVYSIKVAFQIGLVTALVSVLLGSILGAAAAFYAGWVDHLVMWLVSTLSSIPYLVLLTVIAYAFTGSRFDDPDNPAIALVPVYVAFCSVFWISTCRVVRGEVLKIKELEYVQAATAVGFSRPYILLQHVIPNTAHLMFINFSLLFIGAIKSEVILSFLGLGVKGQSSWGIMINLGRDGVTSFEFWEVGVATVFMFVLVLAFNLVSDALQDAFDPKHVG